MRAFRNPLLIIGILSLGLFVGYFLRGPTWEIPKEFSLDKYDVLNDTLVIVLTFVAVAIAVLGAAVYVIVSQRLELQAGKRIRDESRRGITRLSVNVGYSLWKLGFLDEAIRLTKAAHDKWTYELSEKDPENQELIGVIRNNLAS